MELIHRDTKDGLSLVGCYWEGKKEKACIVFTHGMYDNILENNFVELMGEELSKKGYGFIFGHNRGYGVINTILVKDRESGKFSNKIIGSTFEKFGESIYDVDLWVETAKSFGYSKIILASHSFGWLKNLYYMSKKGLSNIAGVIMISPPDTVGLVGRWEKSKEMFAEAWENIEKGNSKKIMEHKMLNIFPISSRTFYSYRKDGILDIFPLVESPEEFGYFSKIDKPIIMFLAERDNVIVETPQKDIEKIKSYAKSTKDFTGIVIEKTTHKYIKKEKELVNYIVDWVEKRF